MGAASGEIAGGRGCSEATRNTFLHFSAAEKGQCTKKRRPKRREDRALICRRGMIRQQDYMGVPSVC